MNPGDGDGSGDDDRRTHERPGSDDRDDLADAAAGRVVVLDVVGLGPEHLDPERTPELAACLTETTDLRPPFPAVTVPAQTTLASGRGPETHGDVANGVYDRERDEVVLWGRDRGDRTRVWESASDVGLTTAALFFQHLVGTSADVAVTPSPIEDENNEMIEMDCWTNPDGYYDHLRGRFGHFPLHNYWGPAASAESSRWILSAAGDAVQRYDPDLLWVYVPHLDYAGIGDGPGPELESELGTVDGLVGEFLDTLRGDPDRWAETAVVVVGEYGFHGVETSVFPNRALREAGLLRVTDDGAGGEEADLDGSAAFAVVDHQVAHVYVDPDDGPDLDIVADALDGLDGIERVLREAGKREYGVDHPNSGDLVLVAESDAWFQYYWWTDRDRAPSYATSVDIHSKPGFDPCELFFGEEGMASLDPSKVGGSHGRPDPEVAPVFGIGGPAAPDLGLDARDPVDARAVAPTVLNLLGVLDEVETPFEAPSLLR